MRIKVSNYIAQLLVEHGISHVFTVTGGGAMHLNDGLGHQKGLTCVYNHHEQACAIAAESYARIYNKIAAVCVTTGPGGTNAITGVVGGYLDSIPMFILSGQVRYDTTARSTGLNLRAMGDQEFDITKAVSSMTKYCEMIIDSAKIRYCVEKALYIAQTGRPGPCWLDIPVDIQGSYIETEDQVAFNPKEYQEEKREILPSLVEEKTVQAVLTKIKEAKRPIFYAGNGIRIAGAHAIFQRVIEKLNIPVVTAWDSIDAIEDAHSLYVGRGGIMGDRAGNFAVQNSDFILAVGNRLSIRQVGYHRETWAREAFVVMVDADAEEMKKPVLHCEMPIHADAKDFLEKLENVLEQELEKKQKSEKWFENKEWSNICQNWKKNYPVVQPKHYSPQPFVNVYAFIKELSSRLFENQITVVGNGSACVVGSHGYVIKKGQRFIINSAIASMGYDLPAAIGACVAAYGNQVLKQARPTVDAYGNSILTLEDSNSKETEKSYMDVILVTGDGSIQMNLQELQTIIHHRMPIKIFLINNNGYHSIRQTQSNFFEEPLVGIGYDSGDLSFPEMEKLAEAYGYPYRRIDKNEQLGERIEETLALDGPVICEIMVSMDQKFEPKSATKRLEDGTLISPPLEDLAPFLEREELEKNMLIPLVEE